MWLADGGELMGGRVVAETEARALCMQPKIEAGLIYAWLRTSRAGRVLPVQFFSVRLGLTGEQEKVGI